MHYNELPEDIDIDSIVYGDDERLKLMLVRRGVALDRLVMDNKECIVQEVLDYGYDVRHLTIIQQDLLAETGSDTIKQALSKAGLASDKLWRSSDKELSLKAMETLAKNDMLHLAANFSQPGTGKTMAAKGSWAESYMLSMQGSGENDALLVQSCKHPEIVLRLLKGKSLEGILGKFDSKLALRHVDDKSWPVRLAFMNDYGSLNTPDIEHGAIQDELLVWDIVDYIAKNTGTISNKEFVSTIQGRVFDIVHGADPFENTVNFIESMFQEFNGTPTTTHMFSFESSELIQNSIKMINTDMDHIEHDLSYEMA